jgi:hypothetical protein
VHAAGKPPCNRGLAEILEWHGVVEPLAKSCLRAAGAAGIYRVTVHVHCRTVDVFCVRHMSNYGPAEMLFQVERPGVEQHR